MLAINNIPPRLLQSALTPATLVRMLLDPVIAIAVLLIAGFGFGEPFDAPELILMILVFALTFPGSAPRGTSLRSMSQDIVLDWTLVVALLLFLGWATGTLDAFDQRVMLTWALCTPVALLVAHRVVPLALSRALAAEGVRRVAVIAGANELGRRLAQQIEGAPFLGVRFAGYFDDRGPARRGNIPPSQLLGPLQELAEFAKKNRVDLIYIALPMASQPRILGLLDQLSDTTASIYFAPDIFVFDLIQARMDMVGEMPVVAVCETPLYGVNAFAKRASDVILATLILILISPLMLAIAIGVKWSSPGPVLFKQRRYGLDGREIIVYKFRSMSVLEDGHVVAQATRNDPRVTPFGAFLRRTSLDELPQFINVLQGRMSVVGPRPHAVAHNEQYRKLIKRYMIRHKVKPGITGWAQVNGLRGETDTVDKMKARIEYDLAYLRHWSLRLDLQIVFRTIFVVLKKQNAY